MNRPDLHNLYARTDDQGVAHKHRCTHCGSTRKGLPMTTHRSGGEPYPDRKARLYECGDCGHYWERQAPGGPQ